jgi:hypothetical protein
MLSPAELTLRDNWPFKKPMPSRTSAARELLKPGLVADGFESADDGSRSKDFVPGGGGGGTGYNSRFENDGHIVRAGLNYKFGAMGGR